MGETVFKSTKFYATETKKKEYYTEMALAYSYAFLDKRVNGFRFVNRNDGEDEEHLIIFKKYYSIRYYKDSCYGYVWDRNEYKMPSHADSLKYNVK
jgi:hypothetical protein